MDDSPRPAQKQTQPRRWRKRFLRLFRALVIAYLTVTVLVFLLQTYLIFPGATTQGQVDARLPQGRHYDLLSLQDERGKKIAAIFGLALDSTGATRPDAGERPTIIFFYGNGACMAHSRDIFDEFRGRGFNVIIPDYEGYGMSEGNPSETGCYATADAVYDYLLTRPEVRRDRIVVVGWSLGGAVAIDLASRKPIAGVATLSAFTNMKDMAHKTIPWLPTSLLLRHHFDNIDKIRALHVPLFLAHGTADTIVPPEMCDRLASAAGAPVTLVHVQGADHDIFDIGGEQLFDQIQQFIDGLPNFPN
jgi:fermentation-respiration switch protein FrsA (DUF1100 family)